ncbi:hypothetical protein [Pararhizobium arenae]|uniref:hypothetical protein n=1 Tax=Pararhizobium arenae TaxID=1856850 RepID=UPI000AF0FF85|nr:hypothetical protein [Pararhizobium arenae]
MNTTMSLLLIRRVLNEFCEERGLSVASATATNAARFLMQSVSDDVPSIMTLRSSLSAWVETQAGLMAA